MHVPVAPVLILGGLLGVAALDVAALSSRHKTAPAAQHVGAAPALAAPAAAVAVVPRTTTSRSATPARPAPVPVPHAVVSKPRSPRIASRPATPTKPRAHRSAGTTQADLTAAVSRLRGYQSGSARWVLSSRYGKWGTADWYNNVVYISPSVPLRLLRSVVIHEWDHLLSVRPYGGDVAAAVAAMNSVFGGTGLVGAERAADCMARLSGATWTHYTSCTDEAWRAGARLLLEGRQL